MASAEKPIYTIQVRELVEFVLRRGDIAGERHFVGMDRAVQGIRGHQKIQRSRPPGYETEIALEHEISDDTFVLRIRGRIDGLLKTASEVLLEEIKTVHGRWDHTADPLHWAQAKLYAYIYAQKNDLKAITIQLTYLELETLKVTEFRESLSFAALEVFFTATTSSYLEWLRQQIRWQNDRDDSIGHLNFPFKSFRPGQRKMAVLAYKTCASGGRAFIAAPTGIGKTISALFPAVKSLGEGKLKRIYYLTARTVGQGIAEKALRDLRKNGLRLRAVTLTARHKVCIDESQPCDPASCPLATGYYDRRKPAMLEALAREEITREVLDEVGQKHRACPFALAHDVSLWADAVICDYNYVFDPKAYLQQHFAQDREDFGFLVDEAHNLVDRAREMFSEDLDAGEIREVLLAIKSAIPACARSLGNLEREIKALCDPAHDPLTEPGDFNMEPDLFARPSPAVPEPEANPKGMLKEFPKHLIPILEAALDQMEKWLARNEPAAFREDLLSLYFRVLSFRRTAEIYDERFVTLLKEEGHIARVRLFCLDPSHLLRQALNRGRAAIFFSATLAPIDYYRTLLGGEENDPFLQLNSPFPRENLAVLVQDRIQTSYKLRGGSLGDVVQAIGILLEQKTGNYLIYFPSYQYLSSVLDQFKARFSQISVLVQRPNMTEKERASFLAEFETNDGKTRAAFAVLGGIFGEGIDLVGERLIGAVIVGVGLPQLSQERDLIRDYFNAINGFGFDYAYTFPGMNRVLQAVGRVIRSENDRGLVLLIDTRFSQPRYQHLFPAWWRTGIAGTVGKIETLADAFWSGNRP